MMLRIHGGPTPGMPPARPGTAGLWSLVLAGALWLVPPAIGGSANPNRGLWVGQVTLNQVNEVPVVLDQNNQPVAPDPKVATPTADQAHLRLILHVNGAGQVSLLKDVAVLARTSAVGAGGSGQVVDLAKDPSASRYLGGLLARESDMALVTDERLYGTFPPQPALRLASAVFDFGDGRATDAVRAVIDAAAAKAAAEVLAGRTTAEAEAEAKTEAEQRVVARSDVAAAFATFLSSSFPRAKVNLVADGNAAALQAAREAAGGLLSWSPFFPDVRASNMVEAVHSAAQAPGLTDEGKRQAAQNWAAAYADLADEYQRFLAGKAYGDMIAGGAAAAATAAVVPGATAETLSTAVRGQTAVRAAQATALTLATASAYADTRAPDAVNTVVDAIIAGAAALLPAQAGTEKSVQTAAEAAARTALADQVLRYPVPQGAPTTDYTAMVKSAVFIGSPAIAAEAAAQAAAAALAADPFLTLAELTGAASDAATDALRVGDPNAFKAAAQAAQRELPLSGAFGNPSVLLGTLFLPASHPTNPFRHRRHPDHRYGYDITRRIQLDFDAQPAGSLEPSGYGVSRVTGVYREEIFGLHKPLGPNKDVGLRVQGRFELNRISLIDSLNAR